MGKATRAKQLSNMTVANEEKSSLKQQELHMYLFTMEGKWFLLSMLQPMGQLICTEVSARRTHQTILQEKKTHMRICESHGFEVPLIIIDEEPALVATIGKIPNALIFQVAK